MTPTPGGNALNVAVSFDRDPAVYTFGELVIITVNVIDPSGQPVARADVVLEILTANGQTVVKSARTNRSGIATFVFQPEASQGAGTYTATATATSSGFDPGVGSATFEVTSIATSCDPCGANEQVSITVTVAPNGEPVAGASVRLRVITASGAILAGGATTAEDGQITLSFTPIRSFGAGVYIIEVAVESPSLAFDDTRAFTVD